MASFMEAIFVMEQRANPFLDRRVAFAGKLGGMTLREASSLVRRLGGTPVSRDNERIDLLVLGAEVLAEDSTGTDKVVYSTMTETELWGQLGLLESSAPSQLYTPAMLADLLSVPVATIRRWHRRGLIQSRQTVHRLPYFAFEGVAVARRLLELQASGASLAEIERQIRGLDERWPDAVPVVEGRKLLVRRGEAILEADGQQRFDFAEPADSEGVETIQIRRKQAEQSSAEQLIAQAEEHEEAGDDAGAADLYRSALVAAGANAQVCFQLAECLYRLGDLSAARERYSMAIELEEGFLEARANLGCLLAESGETDLAVAALEGALELHADYADAHYHLARLLAAAGREDEARQHRQRFEDLAPASPWVNGGHLAPRDEEH
jgi:tetratricopeptide (TPR) repeat protein